MTCFQTQTMSVHKANVSAFYLQVKVSHSALLKHTTVLTLSDILCLHFTLNK